MRRFTVIVMAVLLVLAGCGADKAIEEGFDSMTGHATSANIASMNTTAQDARNVVTNWLAHESVSDGTYLVTHGNGSWTSDLNSLSELFADNFPSLGACKFLIVISGRTVNAAYWTDGGSLSWDSGGFGDGGNLISDGRLGDRAIGTSPIQ